MDKFLKIAMLAAKKSAAMLQSGFREEIKTTDKNSAGLVSDWVTKYDYAAQKIILQIITRAFPTHSLLSEEGISITKNSPYQWIIDPLDGTTNFSRGIANFSSSIALSHRGKIILGVITLPAQKETCWAAAGQGTFLNGKRVRVSKTKNLRSSLIGVSMLRSRAALEIGAKTFQKLLSVPIKPRIFGSIAADLARVASGQLDAVVFNHSMPWDIAAGILLVKEAGGKVTGRDGKATISLKKIQLVASNGHLHKGILSALR